VNVYAKDKLIGQARQLAAEYRRTMGKSLPGVGNEIALHDAIRLLGLEPVAEGVGGYDATDPARDGKKIQIKSRTIIDEGRTGQRIGQIKVEQPWDSVLLVLMDADYEPFEIHEAEREELLAFMNESSSGRARRGALSLARFKIIGCLVWTREEGVEPVLWSNQEPVRE
jgi:hypothetical protein